MNCPDDETDSSLSHVHSTQPNPKTSRILPLPADVVSQIHSSKQIISLQGVVLALLENSLDSDATKVDISFSFARGSCTVEDNGTGIPATDFVDDGGLCKMYHTSKAQSVQGPEVHGFTGSYLTSLSALSLLNVTSRQVGHEDCASLTLHQGKVIARHSLAPASEDLRTFSSHGTRVTVRDLFGNMPVRVKQRVLASELSSGGDEKAWQELKHGIVALLLAWRSPCSVKFRDLDVSGKSLTLSASYPTVSVALTEKSLNQLFGKSTRYDLRDALPVLFQAGLAPSETRSHWVPISASTMKLSVRGSICLDPAPTKLCQFVSIGVRPYSLGSGHNEVYESINKVFANSSFGILEGESQPNDAEKDRRKRDRRYKSDGYTQKQTRGGKGIDRWPMFVLQIKLRDYKSQVRPEMLTSNHQLQDITDVLEAMVEQWLSTHNFRPKKKRKRKNEEQQSPAAVSGSTSRTSTAKFVRLSPGVGHTSELRRTATANGTLPRHDKRRIIDLSGSDTRLAETESPGIPGYTSMPRHWSRIKSSSRSEAFNDEWNKRKPATAPEGVSGSVSAPLQRTISRFHLPPLEPGSLASAKEKTILPAMTTLQPSAGSIAEAGSEDTNVSSEHFGGISDGDLLTALRAAEAPQSGHSGLPARTTDTGDRDQYYIVEPKSPTTHQVYKVNSRTGIVLPAKPMRPITVATSAAVPTRQTAAVNTATTSLGRPLTLSRRITSSSEPAPTNTLPSVLRDWQNPVFAQRQEAHIPVASIVGPGVEAVELAKRQCTHLDISQRFLDSGSGGQSKISKAALAKMKVIRQVDAKFILCSALASDERKGGQPLILVDQHAASERVILETLFSELCAPISPKSPAATLRTNTGNSSAVNTALLDTSSRFEITADEYALFQLHAAHFARWGILYDLLHGADALTSSQVRPPRQHHRIAVRALPPAISERCKLFPKLLMELLRAEIWHLAELKRRPRSALQTHVPDSDLGQDSQDHVWLKHIGSCPKGLLDMVNSRACRSAVMFNDVLSVGECEGLMQELGRCAFPFMCAHGRVSMVPIVEVGTREGAGLVLGYVGRDAGIADSKPSERQDSFVNAYRHWKSRERGSDTVSEMS